MVAGSAAGALARVSADSELADPHAAQLDRGLSDLLECGLYKAGQQAKAARRLVGRSGQGILRSVNEALHIDNPGDIVGLGADNSASAELGLALALLMYRAQTQVRAILATGALELSQGNRSVPVLPIHHLGQKFRTVLRHFGQPGSANAPRIFLAPEKDPDGAAIADRYRQEIAALKEAGVEVLGVSSLGDAARLVGAHGVAMTRLERIFKRGLVATVAGLTGAAIIHAWYDYPIALSFASVANPDGSISVTPARRGATGAGMGILPPCHVSGTEIPAFAIGDQVAVRLKTGQSHELASVLGGYEHALVSISSTSGVKVMLPSLQGPIVPGSETGYVVSVRAPEEETALIWLAKRGAPFDPVALESNIHHVIDPLNPAERITAARNFLSRAAPGSLFFTFRSIARGSCL